MIFIGASDGVYRVGELPFESATKVLDTRIVQAISVFDRTDSVFAAATSGLYRSPNSGESWTKLSIPTDEVWSVAVTKNALYAGTAPAYLY